MRYGDHHAPACHLAPGGSVAAERVRCARWRRRLLLVERAGGAGGSSARWRLTDGAERRVRESAGGSCNIRLLVLMLMQPASYNVQDAMWLQGGGRRDIGNEATFSILCMVCGVRFGSPGCRAWGQVRHPGIRDVGAGPAAGIRDAGSTPVAQDTVTWASLGSQDARPVPLLSAWMQAAVLLSAAQMHEGQSRSLAQSSYQSWPHSRKPAFGICVQPPRAGFRDSGQLGTLWLPP